MNLVAGFSPFCEPTDGLGNFKEIFNKGVNLLHVDGLKGIDAVILWGGADISPTLYAEKRMPNSGPTVPTQRDLFELELCRLALKEGKPIIGVCRGAQFICAFAGGKLAQDVSGHTQGHTIKTHDGRVFDVTSSHHQMLYPFDVNHVMLGWSEHKRSRHYYGLENNSLGENVETEVAYFPDVNGFAIQCHPEWHFDGHPFNNWVHEEIKQACFGVEIEA